MRTAFFAGAFCLLALAASAQTGTVLVCDNPVFDFGEKPQGVDFTGTFTIKNPTDAVVTVSSVIFHCSCSKGKMREDHIPAHGEGTLDFTFSTRNFEGPVAKTAEILIVGGPKNGLLLTMKGTVRPNWKLDRDGIDLGAVKGGDVIERTFHAEVREGQDLDLEFKCAQKDILCETKLTSEKPKKWEIKLTVTVPTNVPVGEFTRNVVVRAPRDPNKPVLFLPILGRVEGDLSVTPRTLSFGRVTNDADERRAVTIESKSGKPFAIKEIKTDQSVLVEGDRNVSKTKHELTFVLQKGLPPRAYRTTIILVLEGSSESSVTITTLAQVEKP